MVCTRRPHERRPHERRPHDAPVRAPRATVATRSPHGPGPDLAHCLRVAVIVLLYVGGAGSCGDRANVMVSAGAASGESTEWIQAGDSVPMLADFDRTDANSCNPHGNFSSATEPNRFSWASSAPAVGDVRPDGMFVARTVGVTSIQASADGGTGSFRMYVVPRVAVSRFAVRQAAERVGDTLEVPFTLTDTAGQPLTATTVAVVGDVRDTSVAHVLGTTTGPSGQVIRVLGRHIGSTWLVARLRLVPFPRPTPDSIPLTVAAGS